MTTITLYIGFIIGTSPELDDELLGLRFADVSPNIRQVCENLLRKMVADGRIGPRAVWNNRESDTDDDDNDEPFDEKEEEEYLSQKLLELRKNDGHDTKSKLQFIANRGCPLSQEYWYHEILEFQVTLSENDKYLYFSFLDQTQQTYDSYYPTMGEKLSTTRFDALKYLDFFWKENIKDCPGAFLEEQRKDFVSCDNEKKGNDKILEQDMDEKKSEEIFQRFLQIRHDALRKYQKNTSSYISHLIPASAQTCVWNINFNINCIESTFQVLSQDYLFKVEPSENFPPFFCGFNN